MQLTEFKSKIAFYSLLTRYLCCVLKTHERERERGRERERERERVTPIS
jgi:hypothetical protein